jgi:predicted RNA-binding protein with TRAM domain
MSEERRERRSYGGPRRGGYGGSRGGGYGGSREGGYGGSRGGGFPPKPVEVGKEYDVEIQETSRRGEGIARVKGLVCFVPNSKPGDKVKIRIKRISRRFAEAEVVGEGTTGAETETETEDEEAETETATETETETKTETETETAETETDASEEEEEE